MSKALDVLKTYWKYNEFRPVQEEIIEHVLQGNDTFVLMPTGGGKSLCFQVPALILTGLTLVVSPLISLIKDQVGRLKDLHIQAEGIYSGMNTKTIHRILQNCTTGKIKMLYLSPERLKTPLFKEYISSLDVSMIVVDEAHCISQWGYDFRPSYLNISEIKPYFPDAIIMALTASATRQVVEDIKTRLAILHVKVFQVSFFRENLTYVSRLTHDKRQELLNLIKNVKGSGIIYCRSRKATSEVAGYLKSHNISASFYHAGLKNEHLSLIQEEWMKGKTRVMVATTAFGMGIDKADVRFVVHLAIPASLEEYYQEAGRGGRDRNKAYAAMFYDESDINELLDTFDTNFPDGDQMVRVYFELAGFLQVGSGETRGEFFDFDLFEFCKIKGYKPVWLIKALKELEQQGYIEVTEGIYLPSQIMFNYNKVELYDFQLRKPEYDGLIELLLRLYGGILNMPVKVNLDLISKKLKLEMSLLKSMLEYMDLAGVIDFQMQKDHPQLSFGAYRYNAEDLIFNFELQNFLKDRYKEKVLAMITFVQSPVCKNITLLDYFGEVFKEPCGICDVCLENKNNFTGKENVEECIEYLLNFASDEDNSITQLINTPFYKKHRSGMQKALQFLMFEHKLVLDNYHVKVKN